MRVLAVAVQGGIADALADVTTFVMRLVGALVVLLVGVLVAKVVARVARRVLDRAGFNRAVDRGGIRRFLAHSRYEPAQILGKLVFWVVLLCALQLALGVFGPNPVSGLLDGLVAYLPRIFVAIVVLVAAGALGRFARDVLRGVLRLTPFGHQLASAAGIAIVVAGCFVALDQLAIAPAIVAGLWYALLIAVVGSVVVAFGVGGIPVARRYLERAADDLDDRFTKLSAVKAAERAAARANRAVEAHATSGTDAAGRQPAHGVAQPGVGYPVESTATTSYPSPDRYSPPDTYSPPPSSDTYPASSPSDTYSSPSPSSSSSSSASDGRSQQGVTRPYGDTPSSRGGGYQPDRSPGTRPPGEQRRSGTQPPGGQGVGSGSGRQGDYPPGVPRPFEDGRSRYGRPNTSDDHRDPPDSNGYGDNYQYPR